MTEDNLGVDFANIRGLAIGASVSSSTARVEDPAPQQQLFTLDANNQLQPVNLTTVGTGNPSEFHDTPRFILVVVSGVTYKDQTCASVLVRKSDSALFCVPVSPASPGIRNAARVQWGTTGDIVTLDSGNALHRLEATGDTLQLTTLRFDGAELVNFAVNAADDVMVNLRQDNGTIIRVHPRSGAPLFITARNQSCVFPGLRREVSRRRGYLPARYVFHMLSARLFWPALNVYMQES